MGKTDAILAQETEIQRVLQALPVQFGAALIYLMEWIGISEETLVENDLVSPKLLQRLRNNPAYPKNVDCVVAICIGMNLPPELSNALINKSATGETFRKIGKTDIQIEFENKATFIGECKIWGGERLFESAIQQVINYSTWHDAKVSVIIFNKKNQSFPPILKKITEWADANAKSYTQPKPNVWKCKYYRQDMNMDIQLTILAFDLYVDRTQFKDSRY